MAKKRSGIKKSRSNTSGRPSAAKREAQNTAKRMEKRKAAKPKKMQFGHKPYSYRLSGLNPKSPKQLPETDLSRKGLSLRQLLRSTPRLFINNAQDVDIIEKSKTKTRSGMPAIRAVTITSDPFRPQKVIRKHRTFIIGVDKDKDNNYRVDLPINQHKNVLVSCDCEAQVFNFEYADAAHGAGRIIYSNGEPPVVTNPSLAPGMCKHLVAVARYLISQNQ